jgi:hypothetical protein
VLDKLSEEFLGMSVGVFSQISSESLKLTELLLDLLVVEGHELISQEFSHKLGN